MVAEKWASPSLFNMKGPDPTFMENDLDTDYIETQQGDHTTDAEADADKDDPEEWGEADVKIDQVGGPRTGWTLRDRDDITAFGHMLSGILKVQPFVASQTSATYRTRVLNRLRQRGGPAPGAVGRIRELMDKIMVKHQ
jgi:hypothetical protein